MTEQEKREKAIEEMVLCGGRCFCTDPHEWYNCKRCKYRPCAAYKYCDDLYNASYRKEEEVSKKTAKEIYKALLGTEHIKELAQKEHCEWWVSRWRLEDLNRVFKEFGVEVEE